MALPQISDDVKACEEYIRSWKQPEVKEHILRGMISLLRRRYGLVESKPPTIIAGWGQEPESVRQNRKSQLQ